jgi:minor curlin subunit
MELSRHGAARWPARSLAVPRPRKPGAGATLVAILGGLLFGTVSASVLLSTAAALAADLAGPELTLPTDLSLGATIWQDGQANRADLEQRGMSQFKASQSGFGNQLQALQAGQGNYLNVAQQGAGNLALLVQSGDFNRIDLDQRGTANSAAITQLGAANTAFIQQFGDGNRADISQSSGSAMTVVRQYGDRNVASVIQH